MFGAGFNRLNIAPIVVAEIFEQVGNTGARLGEVPGDGMARVFHNTTALRTRPTTPSWSSCPSRYRLRSSLAYRQPLLRRVSEPHSSLEGEVEEVTLVCGKVTVGRTGHPGQ